MRIAIFYPHNVYASWYTLGGYLGTLENMGHEVANVPLPGNQVHNVETIRQHVAPPLAALMACDLVISFFHEYTQFWLEALYGFEAWQKLMRKVPVIARFDESFDRADLLLPQRWETLKQWATHFSFPAHQDAQRFGGQFLPFGADMRLFNVDHEAKKKYQVGFVGSMYQLRMSYLEKLAEKVDNGITFSTGPVFVSDLSGVRELESTQLLAENYRQIKVFFCLPPMSRLLVCKVFEVMACGTFVMFPKLPGDARRNNELFENGKHLIYYDQGRMEDNAAQIKHWLEHEDEREAIARAGCALVHERFTLEKMLEQLLELVPKTIELTAVAG